VPCATLDGSGTAGMTAIGVSNVFGTTIGDTSIGFRAVCQ